MYFLFMLVFTQGIWEWRKMAKSALFAALFHCAVLGCRYLIKGMNCLPPPPQENNYKQTTTKATLVADQSSFSFVRIDSVDLKI